MAICITGIDIPESRPLTVKIYPNGKTKTNTQQGTARQFQVTIENIIDIVAKRFDIATDQAEDIVYECQSKLTAYQNGECDYYDDMAEIVYDYLGLDSTYLAPLLEDLK